MDPVADLRRLVNGYQVTQAIHVAALLKLSDHMAESPRTVAELAAATATHEQSLLRLLRALSTVGVYTQHDDGRFANAAMGHALRSDAPGSIAGWARFVGSDYYWQAWAALSHSVQTGENAFAATHGMPVWEYRRRHPEAQRAFDEAMTALSGAVVDAVLDAYDFGRFRTVADVGGGKGALLSGVLRRHPSVRGILFDQPEVVRGADAFLASAGVADRCETVAGSFFEAVPHGADAYVLKSVIHDWPDGEAVAILRVCRQAIDGDGVLLLVEQLLDATPDQMRTAFSDLNMLVGPGGRERTQAEYAGLLDAAGFRLDRLVPTASDVLVLEAVPT